MYKIDNERDIFDLDKLEPFAIIGETGMRRSREYQSTVADPFVFQHGDMVYLFFEVKTDFGVGEIHAKSVSPDGDIKDYGLVLKEPFHISYPQVFTCDGRILMIPETASDSKVWLYGCEEFPVKWKRMKILIDETIVDASLIMKDESIYLVGTNRAGALKIYHSRTMDEKFVDTGIAVTGDIAVSRNAGRPLLIDGEWYRFAQNCRSSYGEKISVLKIEELDRSIFSERLVSMSLFKTRPAWMTLGYHHISLAPIGDKYIVAIDGMREDKFINTMTLACLKIFGGSA